LQHWDTLVEWLDSEGLAADLKEPRWQDEAERRRNLDHIIQVIERWTRHHSAAKLVELGQLMRFPWAPVASVQEALDNPQLNERGYWVETTDPESGKKYKFPGPSVKMSGSPWLVNAEFFPPGDYNQEVYQKRLGLSEDEITQLREEGVV
jgi:crotonobetainyl-CoA:carnitine CoA-transferase CaiB-like acyl-CoA transferase